jgi:photosystem II stability/assembly factor-like uncharacterized protein
MKQSQNFFATILVLIWAVFLNESFAQWQKIPELEYTTIYCMLTATDNTVFAGGDYGTFLRSTDDGSSWTNVMGNEFWVDTVLSLGQGLGYIFAGANGAGSIFRSSDNGETWKPANNGFPQAAKVNAFTFSGTDLFTATNYGVYSSADSGSSWKIDTAGLALQQLYPGDGDGLTGVVANGSKLYTIKWQEGIVYSSATDTISWEQISSEYYNIGLSITSIDTNIFIATQKGIYLYGGGTTWLPRNNGLFITDTSLINWCIFANSGTILFANILSGSSYTTGIYFTSDFGQNWEKLNDSVFAENSVNTITANKNYLFAAAQNGGWRMQISGTIPVELSSFTAIAKANNVILNWLTATETNNLGFEVERKPDSKSLQEETFREWDKIGFVEGKGTVTEQQFYTFTDEYLSGGKYLYRLKQIDFDGSFEYSYIVKVEIGFPDNFSLSQNYPNPFNPTTNIGFRTANSGFVSLKVFDVLGREVATLVNEEKSTGEYEVEFDASLLSNGFYFYVLNAGGNRLSKKMCLIK